MPLKKYTFLFSTAFLLLSCWKPYTGEYTNTAGAKVWGYKPVYAAEAVAKAISFSPGAHPVVSGGNIYAFHNYIFQVDPGLGIHVIDNSNPAAASRIGFINVKGCSEMSIKNDKLYTNSYDDLVVLDFSDFQHVKEYSRLRGVFTEYRYGSPIAQPPSSGYFECPHYDSLVVGWVRDSVYQACYKN